MAGKTFLGNAYKDKVVKNFQDFFGRLGKKHSTRNIHGSGLVKAAVSGENLEPFVTRKLLAPTRRLEGLQKARDRRHGVWADIDDLVDKKIYSREPKLPPAVPLLIIELAQDFLEEDPSVQKI